MCVPSQVPQDMVVQLCGSYSAAELSPPGPALAELRQAQAAGVSLSLYMEESVQELLRDAAERFKGWTSVPGPQHTELACRKVRFPLFILLQAGREHWVCPIELLCQPHWACAWYLGDGSQLNTCLKESGIT